jgi:hypothetical protein
MAGLRVGLRRCGSHDYASADCTGCHCDHELPRACHGLHLRPGAAAPRTILADRASTGTVIFLTVSEMASPLP